MRYRFVYMKKKLLTYIHTKIEEKVSDLIQKILKKNSVHRNKETIWINRNLNASNKIREKMLHNLIAPSFTKLCIICMIYEASTYAFNFLEKTGSAKSLFFCFCEQNFFTTAFWLETNVNITCTNFRWFALDTVCKGFFSYVPFRCSVLGSNIFKQRRQLIGQKKKKSKENQDATTLSHQTYDMFP